MLVFDAPTREKCLIARARTNTPLQALVTLNDVQFVEAARNLVYHAAVLKDEGKDYDLASSMAKLMAAEVAMKTTTEAVQIHGGYGYVKEYHVERLMRDAKITQIYEGTSEIQKLVISREVLKGKLYDVL